jgi:hypothetical protein
MKDQADWGKTYKQEQKTNEKNHGISYHYTDADILNSSVDALEE